MTQVRMRPLDVGGHRLPQRCRISEWMEDVTMMTSGGMLVREKTPWGSRHVPQTVYWIPGVVNFVVAIGPGAVVRNTL